MAKKLRLNKTQAVKDYLTDHPESKSSEIAAALTKKGVEITATYVANIKSTLNKATNGKNAAKKSAAPVEVAPAVVEKPTNGTITLEQIKMVALTIKMVGGYDRLTELFDVIKELGGLKKFKDLAEAMTVPETDAIPY